MTVVMDRAQTLDNKDVIISRLKFLETSRDAPFRPEIQILVTRRLVFVSTQVAVGEFVRTISCLDDLPENDLSRQLMTTVNKRWGTFLYEDSSCDEPRSGLKKFLEGVIHCPVLSSPEMLSKLPEPTLLAYKKLAETLNENLKLL